MCVDGDLRLGKRTQAFRCPAYWCVAVRGAGARSDGDGSFRAYTPASLGAAIRHYREQAGISQAEFNGALALLVYGLFSSVAMVPGRSGNRPDYALAAE
jgi:hypothetical protein